MAHEKIVVGVDIGSTKIAVIAAQGAPSGSRQSNIEILGFSEVPVPAGAVVNGSVENIKQVGTAIREALAETASRSDLDIGVVNVSFGGSHVKISPQSDGVIRPSASSGEEVTQRDVDQLVDDMYRARIEPNYDVLHVLPMEFTVDNSMGVREPVGRTGIKLGGNFLVVSGNTQSIQRTRKSLADADQALKCDKMVYGPLATSLAVLNDNEMKAGIAMVDIGDHTTDLVIYHDRIIRYITSFPIGGRHITNDLAIGCGIQAENAEHLKKEYGAAISAEIPLNIEILVNFLAGRPPKHVLKKNVALIIEERLKEIAAMVYAEIVKSGYIDKLIGGLVLTGGSANIENIENLFARITGMSVRVGYPENLERTAKADAVSNASFSTAIGLALAGLKSIDPRIRSVCRPVTAFNTGNLVQQKDPVKEVKEPVKKNGTFWDNISSMIGKKDDSLGDY
ncbi:cell division protein FtsA [Dyadobacter sandarakinus]|uniref:Cell division protein FtsA n=1 Tax=Dyadobacter sandarakinus TaxID=2747268 RepID=A0ABX7IBD8_9BACT|nr:cell division protein FtsA [Dyadobacter sandarakinus]QRR03128.1 cell division protein FtsA [Dyadobacter sandarakinus]